MAQQVPIHLPVRDANPWGCKFCPCLVLRTHSHPGGTLSFNISGRACGCEARLPFWERRVRSSPLLCPYVLGTCFFLSNSIVWIGEQINAVSSFSFCFKHLKSCELKQILKRLTFTCWSPTSNLRKATGFRGFLGFTNGSPAPFLMVSQLIIWYSTIPSDLPWNGC